MYIENTAVKQVISDRRNQEGLREAIEDFIGVEVPPHLANCQIRGVLARPVATPNGESLAFLAATQEAGIDPLWFEYHSDRFSTQNHDKIALAKLAFCTRIGRNGGRQVRKENVVRFGSCDGKPIRDIRTIHGEPLVDLHHRMFEASIGDAYDRWDGSEWLQLVGGCASSYYEKYLAVFILHGVLYEHFPAQGKEKRFTEEIVFPAIERLTARFGVGPAVVPFLGEDRVYEDQWNEYGGELLPLLLK